MNGNRSSEPSLSHIEEKVAEIWKNVLNVPVGLENATFFDLEGESISAVRLVSRIEEELGVSIDVGDIFEEDPDVHALARKVAEAAQTTTV